MSRAKTIGLILLTLAANLASVAEARDWSNAYDNDFRKYAKRYFGPNFDWRWFKAQAITESNLNPNAKSGAGAMGIMQILPSTFDEIRKTNPHYLDIMNPKWNIAAGIYYDRNLFRHKGFAEMAEEERLYLTFAGYNAGLGGALRAKRKAPPPGNRWDQIRPYAPAETRNYVERIIRTREAL